MIVFLCFWLFSNLFRKLCALSEGRVVVQLLRTFKSERCVVQRRTLPQPLPRRSLLGRVQGRSLLTKESSHDDPSEPEHLPLGTHLGRCFPSHKTPHFHQIKSDHKIKPIISKTWSWKCNIETSGWCWSPHQINNILIIIFFLAVYFFLCFVFLFLFLFSLQDI